MEYLPYIIVGAIVVIFFLSNIRIVPQATEFVVELLGKYKETWQAGIHVKIPVVDMIWDGIHGVVNDMTTPSLDMMEWLVEQLRPLSCNPMLRGSRHVDVAFKNLLGGKMQAVWKCMVQSDPRGRERVLRLCMAIKNWPSKPASEHQISKRLRAKSF